MSLCRGSNPIPWLPFICPLDSHYVNFSLWECHHQNQEHYLLPPTCLEPTLIYGFPDFMSPGVHAQGGALRVHQPTVPKETAIRQSWDPSHYSGRGGASTPVSAHCCAQNPALHPVLERTITQRSPCLPYYYILLNTKFPTPQLPHNDDLLAL